MSRYYIFCRFWPGFNRSFPFAEFNGIDNLRDLNKLRQAIASKVQQALLSNPERKRSWLYTLMAGIPAMNCDSQQIKKYFERWLSGPHFPYGYEGVVPSVLCGSPSPGPSHQEKFGTALMVLDWYEFLDGQPQYAVSIPPATFIIAAANTEQSANDLTKFLGKGRDDYSPSFFNVPAADLDLAERAHYELQLKLLQDMRGAAWRPPQGMGDRIEAERRDHAWRAAELLAEMEPPATENEPNPQSKNQPQSQEATPDGSARRQTVTIPTERSTPTTVFSGLVDEFIGIITDLPTDAEFNGHFVLEDKINDAGNALGLGPIFSRSETWTHPSNRHNFTLPANASDEVWDKINEQIPGAADYQCKTDLIISRPHNIGCIILNDLPLRGFQNNDNFTQTERDKVISHLREWQRAAVTNSLASQPEDEHSKSPDLGKKDAFDPDSNNVVLAALSAIEKKVDVVHDVTAETHGNTVRIDNNVKHMGEETDAIASRVSRTPAPVSSLTTNNDRRRGRLPAAESEQRRSTMLAQIRQHPTLKDDPDGLAEKVGGVSAKTIRRWLEEEDQKYLASQAANPARTAAECKHCHESISGQDKCPSCNHVLADACVDCHCEKVHGTFLDNK